MHTIEDFISNFFYTQDTGDLRWRVARSRSAAGSIAGSVDHEGYVIVGFQGKRYRAHRIILAMVTGEFPDQVDHIDGNRSNNRLENLRAVSNQQNARNQKIRKNNRSGVMGVCWHKGVSKWVSHIRVDGKAKYLGSFDSIQEAANVRKVAEDLFGFHKNHGTR